MYIFKHALIWYTTNQNTLPYVYRDHYSSYRYIYIPRILHMRKVVLIGYINLMTLYHHFIEPKKSVE